MCQKYGNIKKNSELIRKVPDKDLKEIRIVYQDVTSKVPLKNIQIVNIYIWG